MDSGKAQLRKESGLYLDATEVSWISVACSHGRGRKAGHVCYPNPPRLSPNSRSRVIDS
jgi:hypothetical protein